MCRAASQSTLKVCSLFSGRFVISWTDFSPPPPARIEKTVGSRVVLVSRLICSAWLFDVLQWPQRRYVHRGSAPECRGGVGKRSGRAAGRGRQEARQEHEGSFHLRECSGGIRAADEIQESIASPRIGTNVRLFFVMPNVFLCLVCSRVLFEPRGD